MIRQLFLSSASNLILVSVGILIAGLIDGILTGRFLGKKDMAAYGLIHPVYLLLTCLGAVVSTGGQTCCGQLLGKGDVKAASRVFTTNCVAAAILALTGTFFIMYFKYPLVRILGATGVNADLAQSAVDYLNGFAPTFVLVIFVTMLNSFMFLEGDKTRAWVATFVSSVVNVAGNLLNVFVFHKGLFGMAAATSVSYVVSTVILLLHWRHEHILRLDFKGFSFAPFKEVFLLGCPNAVNKLCNFFRTVALNRLITIMAIQIALTAFSIRNNLNNLYSAIGTGIAHGVLLLGAVYTGDEDRTSLKILFRVAMKYGLLFTTAISALVIVFADPIVALYLPGQEQSEVFAMTVWSLRLYMLSVPFYMIAQNYMNLFQAMGRPVLTMIICILDNFACVTAFAYILGLTTGINGVWFAFLLGEWGTLLFILAVIIKKTGHFPRSLDDLMLLPEDFDVSAKDRFRVTVSDMNGVVDASARIQTFLSEQGANRRTSLVLAMAVEELGANIVKWGFDGKGKQIISIYVYNKENTWTLRLRDNCKPFNPRKWFEDLSGSVESEMDQEQKADLEKRFHHIGIQMILSMAEDVNYINALKINNLVIKIPEAKPKNSATVTQLGASSVFHPTA